jgi:hypothetical protein
MNVIEDGEAERKHIACTWRKINWFALWLMEDLLEQIANTARATCLWFHVCTCTVYTCVTGA